MSLAPVAPDAPAAARPASVGAWLHAATRRLAAAGVDTPRLDARVLLAHVLGCDPAALFGCPERPVATDAAARFEAMLARRAAREPVARLRGWAEFWSLPIGLGPATLVPRADSETVVETALRLLGRRAALRRLSLLDVGTGSGCLLLALLSALPRARGLGVDVDRAALATARRNAAMLGLDNRAAWRAIDAMAPGWTAALPRRFDAIIANLPYVRAGDIAGLASEVALYEPPRALAGGVDGLACFRRILPAVAGLLAPGGVAVFEVGAGQAAAVAALGRRHRLRVRRIAADLGGIPRCVGFAPGGPASKKSLGNHGRSD